MMTPAKMSLRRASCLAAALGLAGFSHGAFAADQDRADRVVDDAVITSKLKADLARDPDTKALDINVDTNDGVVKLSGFVDSTAERAKADVVARNVEGVSEVRNDLQVQGAERSAGQVVDDAQITARIKTALTTNPITKAREINVQTHAGVVQLSGFADSPDAKAEAGKIAEAVSGVRTVQNDIDVR